MIYAFISPWVDTERMGDSVDRLRAASQDVVALGAIERVKGYVRTIKGRQVHVGGYSRKGDGPNHRALFNTIMGKPTSMATAEDEAKWRFTKSAPLLGKPASVPMQGMHSPAHVAFAKYFAQMKADMDNGHDDYGAHAARLLSDAELALVIAERKRRNARGETDMSGAEDLRILLREQRTRATVAGARKRLRLLPGENTFGPTRRQVDGP